MNPSANIGVVVNRMLEASAKGDVMAMAQGMQELGTAIEKVSSDFNTDEYLMAGFMDSMRNG